MTTRRRLLAALGAALFTWLLSGTTSLAHDERLVEFAGRGGAVPTYRTEGPRLVVCTDETASLVDALPQPHRADNTELLSECGYEKIQSAVDAVTERGTRILVMPGVYGEGSSLSTLSDRC